jgi:hypothetical protein
MYFFRTFKKSTALYKVHNMGLRYINNDVSCCSLISCLESQPTANAAGYTQPGDSRHVPTNIFFAKILCYPFKLLSLDYGPLE